MASFGNVTLDPATTADAVLLSNLLELYIHDLSDVFPSVKLGVDGRFGYSKLPLYWSEPDRRFAFIIKVDGQAAGFVLATRGSPVTEDPGTFDVAEFFVIRQYRRSGVGRRAAQLLWSHLPGKWTVRVSKGNPSALGFWRRTIAHVTSGGVAEFERPGTPNSWLVLAFEINSECGDAASLPAG